MSLSTWALIALAACDVASVWLLAREIAWRMCEAARECASSRDGGPPGAFPRSAAVALILARLRREYARGERERVCHLVPEPSEPAPEKLTALCGRVFAPGEAEALPQLGGAPCEACLIDAPLTLPAGEASTPRHQLAPPRRDGPLRTCMSEWDNPHFACGTTAWSIASPATRSCPNWTTRR